MIKQFFYVPRQKMENAERSHNEEMASVTLSAQEKQRELAVLLEQTEAGHQQRGQWFHPPQCPFVSLIIVIYYW